MGIFGNIILCDAVYTDRESNKAVLAGVYSGDITVSDLPVSFGMSIYAEYIPDTSEKTSLDLMIFVDGIHKGGAIIEMPSPRTDAVAMLVVPNIQLSLDKTGVIEVRASFNRSEPVTIMTKKVVAMGNRTTTS